MAGSSWKGFLKLSLVSVPVRGFPAHKAASEIRLNQLHSICNSRIKYHKVCPIHGEVPKEEIVSGYEYADDQYVVVDADELAALRGERDRAVNVEAVVAAATIDPLYFGEKTYYLLPDGAVGQKPYSLLQKCLADEELECVARVALYGRQELVLVRAVEELLALTSLKFDAALVHPRTLSKEIAPSTLTKEELNLTKTLLTAFRRKNFSMSDYKDDYKDRLRELIEAKVAGKELVTPPPTEEPRVINLMDALKQSLAAAKAGKAPARASSPRKASVSSRRRTKPKPRRKTG